MRIVIRTLTALVFAVCTLGLAFLVACNGAQAPENQVPPLPSRLVWDGQTAASAETDSNLAADSPERKKGIVKIHRLDFPNSGKARIVLKEYAKDYEAYRAFQALATAEELREGVFREKNNLFFIHGRFLGEIQPEGHALVPISFLKERLAFPPEEAFLRPKVFRTFPLSGQIPASERVLAPDFLGKAGKGILLAMAYQCHEDTAYLFRGLPPFEQEPKDWMGTWKGQTDTLGWTGEMRFSGTLGDTEPLVFWNFKGGFVGILGCFDPRLAQEYAEKMKKTGFLLDNL